MTNHEAWQVLLACVTAHHAGLDDEVAKIVGELDHGQALHVVEIATGAMCGAIRTVARLVGTPVEVVLAEFGKVEDDE